MAARKENLADRTRESHVGRSHRRMARERPEEESQDNSRSLTPVRKQAGFGMTASHPTPRTPQTPHTTKPTAVIPNPAVLFADGGEGSAFFNCPGPRIRGTR